MNAAAAVNMTPGAAVLDAVLPQTQCGQCGYQGCMPYAKAMAAGVADINRCPPGGDAVIEDLARLLGKSPKPLDVSCGESQPPAVALIDEAWCIGCTLCIQACPVDAIAGAAKVMHTVIASECTGCALCLPPCPVDCIRMVAVAQADTREARVLREARASQYRSRYLARQARLTEGKKRKAGTNVAGGALLAETASRKQSAIERALARAQARIGK